MQTLYVEMIFVAALCLTLTLIALFLMNRLSRAWKIIGQGEVDHVIFSPPVVPGFFEPIMGAYQTRGYYEVHFTDGKSCTCLGRPPENLKPGEKVQINENALCEISVERI